MSEEVVEAAPRIGKRTADRQISKEEDQEEGSEATTAGTFQKASAEVIKGRRIVKARMPRASTNGDKPSNAFKGLAAFTAPVAPAPAPALAAAAVASASSSPVTLGTPTDVVSSPAPTPTSSSKTDAPSSVEAISSSPAANPALVVSNDGDNGVKTTDNSGAAEKDQEASEGKEDEKDRKNTGEQGPDEGAGGATTNGNEGDGTHGESSQSPVTASASSAAEPTAPAPVTPAPAPANLGFSSFSGISPFQSVEQLSVGEKRPAKAVTGKAAGGVPLTFTGFGSVAASGNAANSLTAIPTASPASSTPAMSGFNFGAPAGSNLTGLSFNSFSKGASWGSVANKPNPNPPEAVEGDSADGGAKGRVEGLLDPSQVVNGEEGEECTFKTRAKLYRLNATEWAEVGVGLLKVLHSLEVDAKSENTQDAENGEEEGDKAGDAADSKENGSKRGTTSRVVMRRDASQQVVLNVSLQHLLKGEKTGEKAVRMSCLSAEGPMTYLLRVKTGEDADSLVAAIVSQRRDD